VPVRPQLSWALAAAIAQAIAGAACGGGTSAGDTGPVDAALAGDGPTSDAPITGDARPGESCSTALEVSLGEPYDGDTTGFPVELGAGCSVLASEAPQVVHQIEVGPDDLDLLIEVAVDESSATPFDAVLMVRSACALGGPCADRGWGERLEALAVSNAPFIVVDGTVQHGGQASGAYTLTTATRPIVGEAAACDPAGLASRCAETLRCVSGECVVDSPELACSLAINLTSDLGDGLAARAGAIRVFDPDLQELSCAFDSSARSGVVLYRFQLAAPARLVATTDFPETTFDTVLAVRAATCDGAELGCADDVDAEGHTFTSRLEIAALPAGAYYLVVDSSSPLPVRGAFRLEVTLD
jgi:hypothetical protein